MRERSGTILRSIRVLLIAVVVSTGCDSSSRSGRAGETASSPTAPAIKARIVFSSDANPLPTPFPNDRFTVKDPTSPTGRRVQLTPKDPGTVFFQTMVTRLNELDGFGLFAPISVRFDQPLDIASITPGSVRLINLTDGTEVPLDMGQGHYPDHLTHPLELFPGDPKANETSLLFGPMNAKNFYEEKSHTLLIRPIRPMNPGTRYVVLLTKAIRGMDGTPILPPLAPSVNADELIAIQAGLNATGLVPQQVAYGWPFTTQTIAHDLEVIRAGLDGQGPLAWLKSTYPARIDSIWDLQHGFGDDDRFTYDAGTIEGFFDKINVLADIMDPVYPDLKTMLHESTLGFSNLDNMNYFVFGTFQSPSFIQTDSGTFQVNANLGQASVKADAATFVVGIPKPTAENDFAQPPYPTVVFGHGLSGSRMNAILIANSMAKHGYATICVDAVGHGPQDEFFAMPDMIKNLPAPVSWAASPVVAGIAALGGCGTNPIQPLPAVVDDVMNCGAFAPFFTQGRAFDVDGDGTRDPTEGFASSNFFKLRDNIRQTVVDQMQLVRIVRGLGFDANGNGTLDRVEGDFNQDGVLDLGGPAGDVQYIGHSLGSLMGGLLLAIDPEIKTGVLNATGGGLMDILSRTSVLDNPYFRQVRSDYFGLTVVGQPQENVLKFQVNENKEIQPLWEIPLVKVKDISIHNKTRNIFRTKGVNGDNAFALSIPTERFDELKIKVTDTSGQSSVLTFPSPHPGLGLERGTPEAREYYHVLSWITEPGDPVLYARYWSNPLGGVSPKNVFVQVVINDSVIPPSCGLSLARAGGLISGSRMKELINLGVVKGEEVLVDSLLTPESATGSGLRFYGAGRHDFLFVANKLAPSEGEAYLFAIQDQIGLYLKSNGAIIKDDYPAFAVQLPDAN